MFDIEHEDQMPQLRKWNLYKQKYKLPINFILFPNPASDLVTISFEGDDDVIDIMCNIYDAYGKLVLNHKFAKSDFTFSSSIFNAGIYYVRLLENSNELASQKLILIKK